MKVQERGIAFDCGGEQLVGVLSQPAQPRSLGVVIVVGGPQYRAGSHRQFVLLARHLAAAGYPVLRFDYRSMGDASGSARDFLAVDDDIAAACACLQAQTGVERVVLWGLCDAASAILLYCGTQADARVAGLCLLNPWVRSDAGYAQTQVKHYYGQRLLQPAFWLKVLRGQFHVWASLKDLLKTLRRARAQSSPSPSGPDMSFQARMTRALLAFPRPVLLVLSGRDLTAREFSDYISKQGLVEALQSRPLVQQQAMPDADHTFSSAQWRDDVAAATLSFLDQLGTSCAAS